MSTNKYRKLLTNLPSMAAVVNSFQSQDVQLEVYRLLVGELEEAAVGGDSASSKSKTNSDAKTDGSTVGLAHTLVDGDSIHAVDDDIDD